MADPIAVQVLREVRERDPRVLVYDEVELGYCIVCYRAARVIRLQVRPWRHIIPVCGSCLRSLGDLADLETERETSSRPAPASPGPE